MEDNVDDLGSVLDIDRDNLDEEWLTQAKKYFTHAAMVVLADERHDNAKNRLEVYRTKLQASVRLRPKKYGLDRVTDKAVEAIVTQDEYYQVLLTRVVRAKRRVGMFKALVSAFDHRKKALENLVTLELKGWNSEPRLKEGRARDSEYEKRAIRSKGRRRRQ